jgi:hypothetical protein
MTQGFGPLQFWLLGFIGNEPVTFEQILSHAYPEMFADDKADIKHWLVSSRFSLTRSLRRALARLVDLDIIQIKGARRPHRYCLHRLFAADEHNPRMIVLAYRCMAFEEGETLEAKNAAGRASIKAALDRLASEQPSDAKE